MRAIELTFVFAALALPAAAQTPAATKTSSPKLVDFEAFAEAVVRHHPEAKVVAQSVARASAAEGRAGVLSDPQLTVAREGLPLPESLQPKKDASGMMMDESAAPPERPSWTVGLSQTFPWPGTLAAEERSAALETARAKLDASASDVGRRFAAKELFLGMVRLAELLEVQRRNLADAKRIERFANERFRQGIGSHMEFLQSHSETAILKANVDALATDLANIEAEARLWMTGKAPAEADAIMFRLGWPEIAAPSAADAVDLARERIRVARERDLARQDAQYRRSLPSLMASGMVMQRDEGMLMYGAMAGISIPVLSGSIRDSLRAESTVIEHRAAEELAWYEQQRHLVEWQVERRIARIAANLEALEKTIVPQTAAHLDAALVEYSQGRGNLRSILDSQRILLNLESSLVQAREALALAKLDRLRLDHGLADGVMNRPVPQIGLPTMTSGMDMDAGAGDRMEMGTRPGGTGSDTNMERSRRRASPPAAAIPEEQGPAPAGGMTGMGM